MVFLKGPNAEGISVAEKNNSKLLIYTQFLASQGKVIKS